MNPFISWTAFFLLLLSAGAFAQCGITVSCSPDQTFTVPGAPQISGIQSAPNVTDAVVSWATDVDANSLIEYGTDTSYGNQRSDPLFSRPNHSFTLLSLSASTVYHFRITACSNSSLCTTTPDNTFTTQATPQPPQPPQPPTPPGNTGGGSTGGGSTGGGSTGGGAIPPAAVSCGGCSILSGGVCTPGYCAPTVCPESYCDGTNLVEYAATQVLNSCQVSFNNGTCTQRSCVPNIHYDNACDTVQNRLGNLFNPDNPAAPPNPPNSVEILRYVAIAIAVVGIVLGLLYYLLEKAKEQREEKKLPPPDTGSVSPYNA